MDTLLHQAIRDVFVPRERTVRGSVFVYRGALLVPAARALDVLLPRLEPLGFTPFLRADGADVVLQAWPMAAAAPEKATVNVVLFVLTCLSVLFAGLLSAGSPTFDALRRTPWFFLAGVPFAVTLLAILTFHEFGHYFTARYYRAVVSLPYFIPAPFLLFGTMGALIRMRSPARDRNALFDIAAAGPLAGLVVALPAILLGIVWSTVAPAPPGGGLVFGDSLLMRVLLHAWFGAVPPGMMIYTHPVADAAWAGLFVTALNLIPVGQLDGGRIAYALFPGHHRLVGHLTLLGILGLGLVTWASTWFVWAALIWMLMRFFGHVPPMDDVTPLTPARRVVGVVCLILFVLLLPPIPVQIS
ncbi:MAG: site-2 protease family protein [Candidatus Rokubacteria bacterium]|nr:site-2 protease family protein [Candidatus Rokubacteria bacterium]